MQKKTILIRIYDKNLSGTPFVFKVQKDEALQFWINTYRLTRTLLTNVYFIRMTSRPVSHNDGSTSVVVDFGSHSIK
jgi:hypothetical protein